MCFMLQIAKKEGSTLQYPHSRLELPYFLLRREEGVWLEGKVSR